MANAYIPSNGWRCAVTDPPPEMTWVMWVGILHTGTVPGIAYRAKGNVWGGVKPVPGDLWHEYPPLPIKREAK